jgi:hypothetical protein
MSYKPIKELTETTRKYKDTNTRSGDYKERINTIHTSHPILKLT